LIDVHQVDLRLALNPTLQFEQELDLLSDLSEVLDRSAIDLSVSSLLCLIEQIISPLPGSLELIYQAVRFSDLLGRRRSFQSLRNMLSMPSQGVLRNREFPRDFREFLAPNDTLIDFVNLWISTDRASWSSPAH
jgi:hypothetical protein